MERGANQLENASVCFFNQINKQWSIRQQHDNWQVTVEINLNFSHLNILFYF